MSQQRILELRSILDRLAYEYYVLDQPSKSDQEYDRYYQELVHWRMNSHSTATPIPLRSALAVSYWMHSRRWSISAPC